MAPIHQTVDDDDEQYSSEEESTGNEVEDEEDDEVDDEDDEELEDEEEDGVVVEDVGDFDENDEEEEDEDDEEEEGISEDFQDEPVAHDDGIRVASEDLEDDEEAEGDDEEEEEESEEEDEDDDDEDDEDEDLEDEDEEKALFDDEHDDEPRDDDEEAAKRRRTLMILACCCCCLVIIAIILVILMVTGGDKDPKPTSAPTGSPSLIPTIAPTIPRTGSPTATPGLPVVSDTYLRSGEFADTEFGTSEAIRILDGEGDGKQAIILLLFNISAIVAEVDNVFDQTSFFLRLFHVESVNDEISDISVLRLPYTDGLAVESLTWNTFTAPTEGVISGAKFVIEEDSQMLNVDITNLLSTPGRRLRGYTAEEVGDVNMLFLQLQATNNTDVYGELFRSREYLNGAEAPQIVTSVPVATSGPTVSRAPTSMPSISKQPTTTPTRSLSPTITPQPSHSMAPSVAPSASIQPSESPTDRITCDDEPAPCGANAYCVETTGTDVVYCECGDLTRVAFGEACTDEHSGTTLCVAGTCTGEGAQCEEIFSTADVATGIECVCEDDTVVGNDEDCNVTNSTRW